MKIEISNLGPLKNAEFELGDLTIICGQNNTGKTYATYAFYGFLTSWRGLLSIDFPEGFIKSLLNDGYIQLDLTPYIQNAGKIIDQGCQKYFKLLPNEFNTIHEHFKDAEFYVTIEPSIFEIENSYEYRMGSALEQMFNIVKKKNEKKLEITLLIGKENVKIPEDSITRAIGDAVIEIVFGNYFPKPFLISSERTGIAMFRKELAETRNRMFSRKLTKQNIDNGEYINVAFSTYPLPIREDVDFICDLEHFTKEDSFIYREYQQIFDNFSDLIGGEYVYTQNDELYYSPNGKSMKLTLDESSSAVRSLLEIGFYIRYIAKKGDLLMVDEPELNLHPENQRRVARLFAHLVNAGIKVFITTHSDYIIKELNTLIMLNQNKSYLKKVAEKEGYNKQDLISAEKIRVYIAENTHFEMGENKKKSNFSTLTAADIDSELGIQARSFDETIDAMNRIQEEIIWGGEQ